MFEKVEAEKSDYDLAVQLMKNFGETHYSNNVTKSVSTDEIKIISHDIKSLAVDVDLEKNAVIKSSNDGKMNQVDIYTINFENNGRTGYSIVVPDKRINKVYAYVEEGALADTTYIIGLNAFLSYIPDNCAKDLKSYYSEEKLQTKAVATKAIIVQPVTNIAWNQTYPYNKFCPPCSSDGSNGHAYTGCTATAIAMAMAAIKPTALQTAYNLWSLQNTYTSNSTHSTVDDVARLMYMIGAKIGTSYDCNGSSARLRDIRPALDEWNVKYAYRQDTNVDESNLLNCLNYGRPHLTRGERKSPRSGHAWIWTGIDCTIDANTVAPNMKVVKTNAVYCNWGWGGSSNGWFASYEQPDPNMKPFLDNNDQIYILSSGR
jgi:hypothetical protein